MASEPIRSTTITAAPKDYSIPNAQQIRLLSVTAEFIDNGAAGDWLPAVVILDNNGNALCRAVDQGVKVTAGSDAEVSWFPGVKPSSSAAGATVAWGLVKGTGAIVVVPGDASTGNPTVLTWDQFNFIEDGSGVFSFDPLNPQYILCSVAPQPGYFLSHATFEHDDSTPSAVTFGDVRVFFTSEAPAGSGPELSNVKQVVSSDQGLAVFPNAKFVWTLEAWWASRGDTTPIGFYVTVENFNGSAADLNAVAVKFAVSLVAA